MSFTPPAENGTTSLIGRLGKVPCANARGTANAVAEAARPSFRTSRRFMSSLASLAFAVALLPLEADGFDDRRPARQLAQEFALRRLRTGIQHRLEAGLDHLVLERRIGHRGAGLVGDQVDNVLG